MADSNLLVTPDQMRSAANQLEQLCEQANATLQNYLNSAHDIHSSQGWFGLAASTNITTTEEIHNAQMKLTTQWGELINTLRQAADSYEHQESASQSAIAGVSNLA
jgi:WXG100 family type VII secretion target